jgi:indolepyruvate ferredoxin oxidoreductase beta subunit
VDEGGAGGDFPLTQETARQLALWMSYEDVIRVADLKTRRERRERIRGELRAKPSDILRVADFLKPGLEELCSVLPARLGSALYGHGCRRGWQHKLNVGMHIYSTSVGGFLLLRLLASLRWWRPYSWRYREEQVRIEQWLEAILRAASRDLELALAIAACGQIIKGYGDTHARAMGSFDLIARTYFNDETTPVPVLTQAIRAALKAAQSDPEGDALQREIAARSASTRARASFAAAAE